MIKVLSLTLWPLHHLSTWSWPPSLPTVLSWPWSSTYLGRIRPPWQRDWWGQHPFTHPRQIEGVVGEVIVRCAHGGRYLSLIILWYCRFLLQYLLGVILYWPTFISVWITSCYCSVMICYWLKSPKTQRCEVLKLVRPSEYLMLILLNLECGTFSYK